MKYRRSGHALNALIHFGQRHWYRLATLVIFLYVACKVRNLSDDFDIFVVCFYNFATAMMKFVAPTSLT